MAVQAEDSLKGARLDHDNLGNVGPADLAQVRSVLGDLLDIP